METPGKCWLSVCLLAACLAPAACFRAANRDGRSFDQIQQLVARKTGAEVLQLLGEPDVRKVTLLGDQRWTWWNFTYLEGEDYAPEMRGRVVHLEIILEKPGLGTKAAPDSQWRVSDPLGVMYSIPTPPGKTGG